MDLVDLIQEKKFLGQEFLAWLWYKSEERGGAIDIPGTGDVLVVFEKHMLLEFGEGDANETVICRGLQTELQEARASLLMGKKPEQARIRLASGDYEFSVTLTAATMEFRNVKLPKTVDSVDEGEDSESIEGRILERISLIEALDSLIMDLFRMYITVRASNQWPGELQKIKTWVHRAE